LQENPENNLDNQIIGQDVNTFSPKHLDTEESLEPAPDIEIPPPMPVQDQSHMLALGKNDGADNISDKFVSKKKHILMISSLREMPALRP